MQDLAAGMTSRFRQEAEKSPMLHRVGRALYGPEWQTPLSKALQVDLRTIQRWAAGSHTPPAGIWTDLVPLLLARRDELRKAAPEITRLLRELSGSGRGIRSRITPEMIAAGVCALRCRVSEEALSPVFDDEIVAAIYRAMNNAEAA